jgi:hypothetical protein
MSDMSKLVCALEEALSQNLKWMEAFRRGVSPKDLRGLFNITDQVVSDGQMLLHEIKQAAGEQP